MQKVKPKKFLGQHFLTDLHVADRIAATLDDYRGMPVLEVGPGMGVLTQFLLERGHDVTVVELDRESVEYLEHNFPQLDGRIIGEDFCGDRAIHDGGDLFDGGVEVFTFLGDQRRIRGDAGNKSHIIGFADGFHISGIDKKFHVILLLRALVPR